MPAHVLRRCLVTGAAGAAVLLALPAAAGAHVEAGSETVGGPTTVECSFHHGCDGAPTTGLRIQLPAGAADVEPQDPDGWSSTVGSGELTWTGGSVPDAQEATFVATMTLADAEGSTVFLPTIQQCGPAQEDWIDRSDDPGATNAAPRITAGPVVVTPARGDDPSSTLPEKTTNEPGSSPSSTTGPTTAPTTAPGSSGEAALATRNASSTSSSSTPLVIGGIVAALVIAGVVALVLARRGANPPG